MVRALATVTDDHGVVHPGQGWTDIVVTRDAPPAAVDGLLTGWHEPESSHLMMLEAFADHDTLSARVPPRPRRSATCGTSSATATSSSAREVHDDAEAPGRRTPTLPAGRRAVLYALRRRGEATAEQVADQLGMTVSGARQHLTALTRAGLVEAAEMPSTELKRGRRTLAYSATAEADQYFPKAYGELTNELLGYVADSNPELLEDLFAKRRQHRIDNAQTRLAGKRTLGAKVAELTRILDEDGYLATYEKVTPGVYRVIEHNCAIWAVAQRYGQACTSEIDFIRAALPEAEIERVQHMVAGARHCAVRDQSARPSRVSVSASPVRILRRQPLGDERAVARLGIALDAEERRRRVDGHLGDDRREVDMIEDLPDVAVPILGRELDPRALADAEAVVLPVLHVAELGGRRQLLVVAVLDAGVRERSLET